MPEKKKVQIRPTEEYPSRKGPVSRNRSIVISLTGFDLERSEDGLFKSNAAMKNISDLTFCIDSMNKKYTEKVNMQFSEFNETKLYFERNYIPDFATSIDNSDSLKRLKTFDARAIFDSIPATDKRTVLTGY